MRTEALLDTLAAPHTAVLNVSAVLHNTRIDQSGEPLEVTVQWHVKCATDASAPTLITNSSHSIQLEHDAVLVGTTLHLPAPRLWFPNGYGAQHLYTLRASVYIGGASDATKAVDVATTRFGVRHLQNVRNPGPSTWRFNQYEAGCGPCILNSSGYNGTEYIGAGGSNYPGPDKGYYYPDRWQFVINGRPVFARGGNWVPGDMAYGALVHDQERYRRILRSAKLAGYTYMRIWGGGNVEDQSFYDLCDEFGIMLQQDFPSAGCGYAKQNATGGQDNASWAWLESPATPHTLSLMDGWRVQMPLIVAQLINHPSVVRYTLGNEFYDNRSYCPVQALFEDTVSRLSPSTMVRQADPTNIGQRHGPYVFDILGGSGYDCWGGRWPLVGSCDASNYKDEECCPTHLGSNTDQPGCRYVFKGDSGPGDPFEWSEGGAVGMSDLETLREVLPPASLHPSAVGDDMWGFHKAGTGPQGGGMWLDQGGWAPLFTNGSASAFRSIQDVVRASQFAQAEAYRFIYQSGRRRKPHRSLMAMWTYDEPWPNAAHGSIIDYYGRPKMAYYSVKQACAMVDISLHYSNIWVSPGERLGVSVWVDNELDHALERPMITIELFDLRGRQVATGFEAGQGCPGFRPHTKCGLVINASSNAGGATFPGSPRDGLGPIPASLEGTVIFVRASLFAQDNSLLASHDYAYSVAKSKPVAPFASLLNAPEADFAITSGCATGEAGCVTVQNDAEAPCALFVKLTLRAESGSSIPYAIFERNHFILRPGEATHVAIEQGAESCTRPGAGCMVCAEAWNSPAGAKPPCTAIHPAATLSRVKSDDDLIDLSDSRLQLPSDGLSDATVTALRARLLGVQERVATFASSTVPSRPLIKVEWGPTAGTGSYVLREAGGTAVLTVRKSDEAALLSGIGRLVRELRVEHRAAKARLPRHAEWEHNASAALWPMRGHQISTAHYPSSLKTWPEFSAFVRSLAIFGTTQIEVAHIVSAESGSSLVLPEAALTNFSASLDSLGMNVSMWFPASLCNASNLQLVFEKMPRLDSLLHESGWQKDWRTAKACAATLRRHHPAAAIYAAPAAENASVLADFFRLMRQPELSFVSGLATHMAPVPLPQFVAEAPAHLPIRQYSDLCHTVHAQYPMPKWHYAWALTHVRNPVTVLPRHMASIVREASNGSSPTIGVGA